MSRKLADKSLVLTIAVVKIALGEGYGLDIALYLIAPGREIRRTTVALALTLTLN